MADVIEMPRPRGGDVSNPGASERAADPSVAVPDAHAREQALDVTRSWVVEAPAGSGKTGLLIQRYLRLLGSDLVAAPEQVLAITFTRAATEEIRSRILAELEAAALDRPADTPFARVTRTLANAALARDLECGWRLREDTDRIRIRSIDSVAGEIARLLPQTSGEAASARPIEDATRLYRTAARRTLLRLGGSDAQLSDAVRLLLLHRDGNVNSCEQLIAEMLREREQWGGLVPTRLADLTDERLEEHTRPQLDRALDQAICAGLTRVAHALPAGFLASLAQLAAHLGARPGYEGAASPIALCHGKDTPPEALTAHLDHWRALTHLLLTGAKTWRKSFNSNVMQFVAEKEDKQLLKELINEVRDAPEAHAALRALSCLPPARFPDEQWVVTKALLRVLQHALVELRRVFAEEDACDFSEPALLARTYLRQRGTTAAYETARGIELRHLLVDEMQDTSNGQYELLELLTAGWQGSGRTLFLVGDPKQSIYLFRQARVERFVRTLREQRLGGLPLGRLQLAANFRSEAALVSAFNQTFARIFPRQTRDHDEIVYSPAVATRPETEAGGETWHTAVVADASATQDDRKPHISRRHASEIREIIAAWRRSPRPPGRAEPWRIAVLVASRRELKPIVAALRQPREDGPIPFRAINVEPLGERQEILDLLALTRALQHPADRVAWWAILRAPWCGLTLGDLHLLAGADHRDLAQQTVPELLEERCRLLAGESRARLDRLRRVLARALEQKERLPLPELIDRTWRALGGDASLDAPALANSRQYFELIEAQLRDTGDVAIDLLTERLERLYAAPQQDEDAVDLMTIHGAKGLEWDVVLVPELDRSAPPAQSRLLDWEVLSHDDPEVASVMLAPISGRGEASSALTEWIRRLHNDRLRAERRRQFYVACTRAREALHLFGTATGTKAGTFKPSPNSLLEAAWPAAEPHFDTPATQLETGRREPLRAEPFAQQGSEGLAFAAAADERPSPVILRVPLTTLARSVDAFGDVPRAHSGHRALLRPPGSYAARSFGNAVHTFLELAAAEILAHHSSEETRTQTTRWQPRINSLLRADGLPPAQISRLAPQVLRAIDNTLRDPIGLWLVGRRRDARSEHALTLAREDIADAEQTDSPGRRGIRIDRIFRAGPAPLEQGESHLWIVDYKTAAHSGAGLETRLEQEKQRYRLQLEGYAKALSETNTMLGLWYPLLARLLWWKA